MNQRPKIVALAGPNGAGKTTFFQVHLADLGLPFVNADFISGEKGCDPLTAAKEAEALRRFLLRQGTSFVFETVLSERKVTGGKIDFMKEAEAAGYDVLLVFIGLESVEKSVERVTIRANRGGHDVPDVALHARYPRCMKNLARGIKQLFRVDVYDNSILGRPHRHIASFEKRKLRFLAQDLPGWFLLAMKEGGVSLS